ncbi:MAG TPA: potassium-transporting ATPase subunit KdpA [Kofleriaceae bacterium]|nr:potassium-transporting ATPase subunit KdpA [Kofleriaceae bacterium]
MTGAGIAQIGVYWVVLVLLSIPLGAYMARVYTGQARYAQIVLGPVERLLYRLFGVRPEREQSWQRYTVALLVFNLLGLLLVYGLQRVQGVLPGNPNELPAVDPTVAWNTATSFATNTNWQAYGGETTMSNLVQALALGVQNFVSAATGMAVLVALIRGFTRKQCEEVGNFWVDLTRTTLYILLPLSIVLAVVLVSQGVPQTTDGRATAQFVQATMQTVDHQPHAVTEQGIALGPVASQIAIKQLGTNGGGFYNANAAHPFENPTPLSNFFEMLSILLIASALCLTFGKLVGARRQGWALLVTMIVLVAPFVVLAEWQEQQPNVALIDQPIDHAASALAPGGNMEGKELRHGISASALWATTTTAASNGSVNSMHDSYSPLGGLAPMVLMQLGEVAFGGVGSGLYGLLVFAIVAVFIAGLMVGRTPEFLGKKIEAFEMKMASLAILVPCLAVLIGTALACMADETRGVLNNPGPHGFSEVLYAFSSMGNNNGSAFAGLTASKPFFATAGGICMFVARYWIIIPVMAIAGSLARKKTIPASSGTLPTDGPLFVLLLVGTVVLVGALTFVPALALGPIVEHLQAAGVSP